MRHLARTDAVRADLRLCTDERAIRAQSAIWDKNTMPFLFLTKTVFSARIKDIRAENTVGARSAQVFGGMRNCMRGKKPPMRHVARTDAVRADRRLRTVRWETGEELRVRVPNDKGYSG